MDRTRAQSLAQLYRSTLLEDVVPFWTRHAVDRDRGGFFTFLDRDGSLYGTDKPMWLQGRIAWVFARLYNAVEKKPEWLELSRHALDFVTRHGFDSDGRMFFVTTREGGPLRKRRYLFSETFAIMALAEYGLATGERWAVDRAEEVFRLVLRYYQTPGLCEPKENQAVRPTKGHAMPMILLATTQVLRQNGETDLHRQTIDRSIDEVVGHFWKPELGALLETVGPNGEFYDLPEGRCVNPGHAIETSWFLMEEARTRGDDGLASVALEILEASLEIGWDREYGGIFYFADVLGKPCTQYEWDMKLWWPHTEALYATLLAYRTTREDRWLGWFEKVHEYAFGHFSDPEYGEWYGYLHRDGSVSHRFKGNLWKGPYHLSRCLLLCWRLLEEIAEGQVSE